uniref:Uncharacterized protein n=1 Tax=Arundo donax TaxID=35708 RepID=A0A0A9B6L3_ARUDO
MPISREILQRCTISGTKLQVKIHRCSSCPIISNARTRNKVIDVF